METVAFWREREARFLALPGPTDQMDASYVGGRADLARDLEESASALLTAIDTPDVPLEVVYSRARRTMGAAAVLLDGGYLREWVLSGGPHAHRTLNVLHDGFRREAVLAAVGADLVRRGATDDEAIDQWLNLLKRERSPYYRGDGFPRIDNVPVASAAMCAWCATRSYQNQSVRSQVDGEVESSEDRDDQQEPPAVTDPAGPRPSTTAARAPDADRAIPIPDAQRVFRRPLDRDAISRAQGRLGPVLQCYRVLCGMSVEVLADAIEVSKSTILAHLNKAVVPQPEQLSAYASVFSARLGRTLTIEDLLQEALAGDSDRS